MTDIFQDLHLQELMLKIGQSDVRVNTHAICMETAVSAIPADQSCQLNPF